MPPGLCEWFSKPTQPYLPVPWSGGSPDSRSHKEGWEAFGRLETIGLGWEAGRERSKQPACGEPAVYGGPRYSEQAIGVIFPAIHDCCIYNRSWKPVLGHHWGEVWEYTAKNQTPTAKYIIYAVVEFCWCIREGFL